MKKRKQTTIKTVKAPTRFTAADLQELILREAADKAAAHNYMMVHEALQRWLKEKGDKYRIKGQFEIDRATGILTAKNA